MTGGVLFSNEADCQIEGIDVKVTQFPFTTKKGLEICFTHRNLLLSCLFFNTGFTIAQDLPPSHYSPHHTGRGEMRTTVADPLEDDYDVKYLKFNLNMTNDTNTLSGDVTTTAVVVSASFPVYAFELNPSLTIDSVLISGTNCSVSSSAVIRKVTLPAALRAGSSFTAQVFYHGEPVTVPTIFGGVGGYNNAYAPYFGTRVTFTQSESYHASEWRPCKQSLRDKIDSLNIKMHREMPRESFWLKPSLY